MFGKSTPPNEGDKQWERDTIRSLLMQVYKERRIARIVRWTILILFLLIIFFASVGKKTVGHHTALIKLNGPIMEANSSAELLVKSVETAYKSKGVKGIIIEANSPGGSAVLSDVTNQELTRLRKENPSIPLYVVIDDVCASGCYYIAAAAQKIYSNPSSLVGSIGVILGGFGFDKAIDKLGVDRRLYTAGAHKAMGDPFSPENPEETAMLKKGLDIIHQRFIEKVKQGRGDRLKDASDPDVFSGRIYSGSEGKELGLVDEFGSIYSVSRDVIKAPEMVDYTQTGNYFDKAGKFLGTAYRTMLQWTGEGVGVEMR